MANATNCRKPLLRLIIWQELRCLLMPAGLAPCFLRKASVTPNTKKQAATNWFLPFEACQFGVDQFYRWQEQLRDLLEMNTSILPVGDSHSRGMTTMVMTSFRKKNWYLMQHFRCSGEKKTLNSPKGDIRDKEGHRTGVITSKKGSLTHDSAAVVTGVTAQTKLSFTHSYSALCMETYGRGLGPLKK